MRRRRKRKFTWLPTIGTESATGDQGAPTSPLIAELNVPPLANGDFFGSPNQIVFPLVNDTPQDAFGGAAQTDEGIGEIIGNDYVVERIVGKIFIGYTQVTSALSGNNSVLVKAGIFVARADSGNPDEPIGASFNDYSPLALETVREPWMWIRTWMLSNDRSDPQNPFARSSITFGRTNYGFEAGASSFEGPHIDVKSVRRIRQDERLFLTISAMGVNPRGDSTDDATGVVDAVIDIRALGALRKARNSSAF